MEVTKRGLHRAMRLGRLVTLLSFMGLPCFQRAQAQTSQPSRPWLVSVSHYAKWPALAASAGLLLQAALDRRLSDSQRDELRALCTDEPSRCTVDSAGHYLDAQASLLEDSAAERARRAHRLIVAGELSLIVTGAMFVIDIVHDSDTPDNIPFTPFRVFAAGNQLGLQARF